MKKIRELMLSAIAVLFTLSAFAQGTLWQGTVDTDWNNAANWSNGIPSTGYTATILGAASNFPTYAGSPIVDFTIENFGTVTFTGFIYNTGNIVNFSGATMDNDGFFVNSGTVTFNNDGDFNNSGTFENYGMFDNANIASLDNMPGAVYVNYGMIQNFGPVTNSGTFTNFGTILSTDVLVNNGEFDNYGIFQSEQGSDFVNNASGNFRNKENSIFFVNSTLSNAGLLRNDGSMTFASASVIANTGDLNNFNKLINSGEIINDDRIRNFGDILIKNEADLTNNSVLTNNGFIDLDFCARLTHTASNTIASTINNDGTIYNIGGGTVNATADELAFFTTNGGDFKPPVVGCSGNRVFVLGDANSITIAAEDVDNGSFASCGAELVSMTIDPNTFTSAGVFETTLRIEDNFGNVESCISTITIVDEPVAPPQGISPVDHPSITSNCPADITLETAPGELTTTITYDQPTVSSTCVSGGTGEQPTFYVNCNFGGSSMTLGTGEYRHHSQFPLSNNVISSVRIPAGYQVTLYNFSTFSGSSITLTSDDECLIDNSFNDITSAILVEYIGTGAPITDCGSVATIPGYTFMGSNNGSQYYYANTETTWFDARDAAANAGGHLAIADSAEENEFLRSNLVTSNGWLGLSDFASEGNFVTVLGDNPSYTNWNSGEPNNGGGDEHFTRIIQSNGRWTDRDQGFHATGILELPCSSSMGSICEFNNFGTDSTNPDPRNIWWRPDGEEAERYATTTSTFTQNADGSGVLSGSMVNTLDNSDRWTFEVNLINKRDYAAWTASGGDVRTGVAGDPTTWDYYMIDESNSTFRGSDANAGLTVDITITDPTLGVQVGFGANLKDADFGLSTWWDSNGAINGRGDFNADLDNCQALSMCDEITVERIAGPESGGIVFGGENQIAFLFTDCCGNEEICVTNVTVELTPITIDISCPSDINVDAAVCDNNATASWTEPTATSDCTEGSAVTINRIDDGPANGGTFREGFTTIVYEVTDECGITETCAFNVIVNSPAGVLTVDCPGDFTTTLAIGATSGVVNYPVPTGTTTGFDGQTEVRLVLGPASGSVVGVGSSQVIYFINDNCGNSEVCVFNVNVMSGVCINPTTDFSSVDPTCGASDGAITFTFPNAPNRTQVEFSLNGGNTWLGNVVETVGSITYDGLADGTYDLYMRWGNDECPTPIGQVILDGGAVAPGTTCNDGNPATNNDMIQADGCTCAGESVTIDLNGGTIAGGPFEFCVDGTSDFVSGITLNGNTGPNNAWIITDDQGNILGLPPMPSVVDFDGAGLGTCFIYHVSYEDINGLAAGANISGFSGNFDLSNSIAVDRIDCGNNGGGDLDPTVCDVDYAINGNSITISGLDEPIVTAKILNSDWSDFVTVCEAFGATQCGVTETVDNVPAGDYIVFIQTFDANWNAVCSITEVITVTGGGGNGPVVDGGAIAGGPFEFCVDGTSDFVSGITLNGNTGPNNAWIITDDQGNILGLPPMPSVVDFDGAGLGTCFIYHVSYDAINGLTAGANIDAFTGDFDLSNSIAVNRIDCGSGPVVDGGTIAGGPFEFCVDGTSDFVSGITLNGNQGTNNSWIITDDQGNILGLPPMPSAVDFDGAGLGTCFIYHVSYEDINGLAAGANISGFSGNFDLSNSIAVDRIDCGNNGGGDLDPTVCDVDYSISGNSITISGLDEPIVTAKILNSDWSDFLVVCEAFGASPCGVTETVNNVPAGSYILFIQTFDANWNAVCAITEVITVTGGGGNGPVDSDNDGTPDADDCAPNNANLPAAAGTSCNDGNGNTINDQIQADGCTCAGTPDNGPVDSDGDGTPDANDCAPNNANLPAAAGTSCNDGDAGTTNDQIQADGCTCAGTPGNGGGGDPTVCDVDYSIDGNSITITGLDEPIVTAKILNSDWSDYLVVCEAFGATPCGVTETVTDVAAGDYIIFIQTFDANWNPVCAINEIITVTGGGNGGGNTGCSITALTSNIACTGNGDQFTVDVTVSGSNTSAQWVGAIGGQNMTGSYNTTTTFGPFASNSGSTISGWFTDANDSNCIFDVTVTGPANCGAAAPDADGDGTPDSEDCAPTNASLPAAPGSSCNDFDATTTNDVIGADGCSCAGTPATSDGCNVTYSMGMNSITVAGLTDPIVSVKVLDLNWNTLEECGTWVTACGTSQTFSGLSAGQYFVSVQTFDAGWNELCNIFQKVDVGVTPFASNQDLRFDAQSVARRAELSWITNTEFKNDYFVIERSADGETFEAITEVQKANNDDEANFYSLNDENPIMGDNFYRVKQVYIDGTFEYSAAEYVAFNIDLANFDVYPNPANNKLNVNLTEYVGQNGSIEITNTFGQTMNRFELGEINNGSFRIDVSDYQNGVYSITVRVSDRQFNTKMFVVSKL